MTNWLRFGLLLTVLAACGDATDTDDPAAVERGRGLFTGEPGCHFCHTVEGVSSGTAGPELSHIATVGGTRVQGLSAEAYIRQSILDPPAFVVPGYQNGIMPQDYATRLTEQEIADLVAHYMTLD